MLVDNVDHVVSGHFPLKIAILDFSSHEQLFFRFFWPHQHGIANKQVQVSIAKDIIKNETVMLAVEFLKNELSVLKEYGKYSQYKRIHWCSKDDYEIFFLL